MNLDAHFRALAQRERQVLSGIPEISLASQPSQGNPPAQLKKSNDNDLGKPTLSLTADARKIHSLIGDRLEKANEQSPEAFNKANGLGVNKLNELKEEYLQYCTTLKAGERLRAALSGLGFNVVA